MKTLKIMGLGLSLSLLACQPSTSNNQPIPAIDRKDSRTATPTTTAEITAYQNFQFISYETNLSLGAKKELIQQQPDIKNNIQFLANSENPQALMKARDEYIKAQQKTEENISILNSAKTGIDYLLTAGTTAASAGNTNVPLSLSLKALQEITLKSLEWGIAELKNSSEKNAEIVLTGRLKNSSADQLKLFDRLRSIDPQQAQEQMLNLSQKWAMALIPQEGDEVSRSNLRSFYATSLAQTALAALAKEGSAQAIINKNMNTRIDEGEKQFLAIAQTLLQFQKDTADALTQVSSSQKTIQQGLTDLGKSVARHEANLQIQMDDIEFIRDFTLSQMSPERQLETLQRLRETDTNPNLRRKIEMVEERLKFEAGYSKIMSGAQGLLSLAQNFGVSATTVGDLRKGLQAIDLIKQGSGAIASGNYMQGVVALSGLMGIGGESVEDARYRQIMAKLDTIIQNQLIMNQKLDRIFEMQKTQIQMLQLISTQIQTSTEMIYGKLSIIHDDILGNRRLLVHILNRDLESCEVSAKVIRLQGLVAAFSNGKNFTRHLESCALEYDRIFKLRNYSNHFSLDGFKTNESQERVDAEINRYKRSLALVNQQNKNRGQVYTSLTNPSENIYGLISKLGYISDNTEQSLLGDTTDHRDKYAATVVISRVQKMLTVLPAISIMNGSLSQNTAQSSTPLALQKQTGADELDLIDGALELITNTIAQENLLSGDLLLPFFYDPKIFASLSAPDSDIPCLGEKNADHPKCILRNNSFLMQNFIRYAIYREMKEHDYPLGLYKTYTETPDNLVELKNFLKNPLGLAWSQETNSYTVTLAGLTQKIPDFEEMTEGKISYTSTMQDLLALRKMLVDIRVQMSLNQMNLTKNILDTIYKTVLVN